VVGKNRRVLNAEIDGVH